ncbi:MAG: LacI family DNA-binding transcriptional regulator [Lentisphaerota bacterium]
MTTLKDIANLTGVTVNTVSRALKDMPDIGAKTKKRVIETAKKLGYTPNVMARGLVLKRSFTIGVIVTELGNPSRSMLIQKLRNLASSKGYHLLVTGYDTDAEVGEHIREMTSRGVDGLILGNIDSILAEKPFWPDLAMATKSGTPVVTFFNSLTTKIDNVLVDYSLLTEKLTSHLIEKHKLKKISYTGESLNCPRGMGYKRAMKNAGLEGNTGFIPLGYWGLAETSKGIADFVNKQRPPEGIICHNDLTAIGLIDGLRQSGLRVPEDVKVMGVDNIELAGFLNPKLTTIGVDPLRVAEELFRLLEDRIDGKYSGDARQVKLPFEMFLRESCGCLKVGVSPLGGVLKKTA